MTSSAILTPCGVSRRATEPSALHDFSGTGGFLHLTGGLGADRTRTGSAVNDSVRRLTSLN
jgi:hypothetical protein